MCKNLKLNKLNPFLKMFLVEKECNFDCPGKTGPLACGSDGHTYRNRICLENYSKACAFGEVYFVLNAPC